MARLSAEAEAEVAELTAELDEGHTVIFPHSVLVYMEHLCGDRK
jgi:hypothetical protein